MSVRNEYYKIQKKKKKKLIGFLDMVPFFFQVLYIFPYGIFHIHSIYCIYLHFSYSFICFISCLLYIIIKGVSFSLQDCLMKQNEEG